MTTPPHINQHVRLSPEGRERFPDLKLESGHVMANVDGRAMVMWLTCQSWMQLGDIEPVKGG